MSRKLFTTPRFDVCQTTVLVGDTPTEHYFITKPDAVSVVARFRDDMLLVRIKRFLAVEEAYELPGGRIDPGETPVQAARRELLEETGLARGKWQPLITLYPLPSLATERVHLFLVDLTEEPTPVLSSQARQEGICKTVFMSPAEAFHLVVTGAVTSAIDACAIAFMCQSPSLTGGSIYD